MHLAQMSDSLGPVVQRLVNFDPVLSKNSISNVFQENVLFFIEYFSDFQWKKLVNPYSYSSSPSL